MLYKDEKHKSLMSIPSTSKYFRVDPVVELIVDLLEMSCL